MSEKRESFTGKIGFMLSCVGAAIGLGNIWLFSWKLGKYGGAAFLIPYFIFIALFAVVGLVGEISFGRMMKKGIFGLPEIIKNTKIPFKKCLPVIPIISVTGVFIFYVIVFGWVIRYFFSYLTGAINHVEYGEYFGQLAGQIASIPWHVIGIVFSVVVISLGVVKGIEKINKIIMPLMFVIFLGLMVRSLTLPNAITGVHFLLQPDWSMLKDPMTWIMALGQAFFTVGLSGSALLVYGSYLGDDVNIFESVVQTCFLDTMAALMAGFIIIPAAFAFGLDAGAGPSLLFITIPAIFSHIPGGTFLGGIFFLSVIFAALSSAINQLEVPVESVMDRFGFSRKKSAVVVGVVALAIGLVLDLNMNYFGKFADFVSVILIPLGAVISLGIYFYCIDKNKVIAEINKGSNFKTGSIIVWFGRYIFIPGTVIIIILGLIYGGIG
ncbi:sodium-dependent transporter [Fusobacterium ulcerans]|jgi:NSS family neurotransmitter:Na+ symporter|uniref:sodium-dependent transporter n=1 Tax=Fusobacterium ulcerans TaxID=861 RepID=UPI001D0B9D02|nr:sodium-dependent transporter [Fusobacterium ulcerans]MCB8564286.1 sodium-dependent transporter [Fusobacterium ulcerans]MCB8648126.1 sodium-dependent transporter [Fusobacterium ulcerans]